MEKYEKEKINKNESLFSFTKLNKYFIIPFICPIICMIGNYFLDLMSEQINYNDNKLFFIIFVESSYIGGGLVYFITWIRTKTEETKDNALLYQELNNSLKINNNRKDFKNKTYKILCIIILLSIFISSITLVEIYSYKKNIFEERLYFLFFVCLFSKFILKIDIFSHHILSLFIAFIGLILLFIPVILIIEKEDIIINICLFISSIGFSLFVVLIKYLTHYYYFSPFLCILFSGIISIIFTIIGFLIYSFIENGDLSFIKNNFKFEYNNKKLFVLYSLVTILLASILQLLTVLVIYYFTPTLYVISDIVSPTLTWLFLKLPKEDKKVNIIYYSLGYIISIFASLLYNEIIIFNFCGLNENTKKYIEERQKEEITSLREIENKINNDNLQENDSSFDDEYGYTMYIKKT